MKKYLILLLSFLAITACQDDIITETKGEDEIGDPVILDNSGVEGRVNSADGEPISNTLIQVFQNSEEMGTIMSDTDGSYNTENIALRPNIPIILIYSKEDYINKSRKFDLEPSSRLKKNVTLGLESNQGLGSFDNSVSSILNDGRVKLYGYAKNTENEPISGVTCFAVWDYEFDSSTNTFAGEGTSGIDLTDEDGYFEILVPQDSAITFKSAIFREFGSIGNNCHLEFTPDLPIASDQLSQILQSVDLGLIEEDTDVGLRKVEIITSTANIQGFATRCFGANVKRGNIKAVMLGRNNTPLEIKIIENYEFGPNGEYDISLETCPDEFNAVSEILVIIEDTDVNFEGHLKVDYQENLSMDRILLCNDLSNYEDIFDMTFDDIHYINPEGGDDPESGLYFLETLYYIKSGNNGVILNFELNFPSLGSTSIKEFQFHRGTYDGTTTTINETIIDEDRDGELRVNITEIDGPFISGTIEGIANSSVGPEELNIRFTIYDK